MVERLVVVNPRILDRSGSNHRHRMEGISMAARGSVGQQRPEGDDPATGGGEHTPDSVIESRAQRWLYRLLGVDDAVARERQRGIELVESVRRTRIDIATMIGLPDDKAHD